MPRPTRFKRKCVYCNENATKQCDYAESNKICGKPMCEKCAMSIGLGILTINIDYCKEHYELRKADFYVR